ncbi:hypothetical protein VSH64_32405 [Amycolatopsis rhabdoformis]|uniref:PPE domain-containing protein n=1 Tax=Amycolatopsis rhabdoformis TaxID=1448059 RepID=A0ABZ1I0A1_9PSEU|nr:hypothetical protein [Amycolatopsis rhabdoformis]WSE27534.1 hypothetical protein VSH64_32405 [Amycolatopsis rhabdoformis]
MTEHRTEHREYEADYYAQTHADLSKGAGRFGVEDQRNVREGIDKRTQQSAQDYSVTQGNQLLSNQTTRADAPTPTANYAAYDHSNLYDMVHTNMDVKEIDDRGRVANKIGNWLADISNSANTATAATDVEWQGAAADQAHGFFQKTADYTAQTANAAQLSSNRYSQQAAAADYAQKNMPEPVKFDQQAEMQKATQQLSVADPAAAAQTMNAIAAKQQQADAAHQQAVQVMQGLDNTYHETASTQPAYSPPPRLGGGDDSTHTSSAQPGAGLAGHAGALNTGGGSFGAPGGGAPGAGSPGGGGTAGFNGNAFTPPGAGSSTGAGAFGGPGGTGGGGFRPPAAGGGFGRLSPDALAFGGGGPGGAGGAGEETLRGGRPGAGGGRAGGGFAGSRVSGGGAAGRGGVGEGGESGKGAGERLERGATAAANAGKAGKAGAPGAAGAGGGKKKEEGKEHKNKLPNQEDPDEVFEVRPERGPDGEKITPPVIGG